MLVLIVMIAAIIALSGCAGPAPTPTPKPTEAIIPVETTPVVTETIAPKEGSIKFVDIAAGELIDTDISKNTIFVAENATQVDMFGKWDSGLSNKAKNNLDNMLIVAVFLNNKNTGSAITIKDISQTEGKIRITANLTAPEAGGTRVSYPYDVIAVPKDQIIISAGTIWQVYSEDGNLLAETTYP